MNTPYLNVIANPAYYNDFEESSVAWLRELIKRGLIAPGEVDGRSILDVTADDLRGFTQCHFFAGIGGWSYALRLAGWPDEQPVWTGSPPCQPFSAAGRQEGRNDARHLAPHFVDLVRVGRPGMLFGEQVASAEVFGKPAKPSRRNACPPPQWAWIDDLSNRLEAACYAVGANDFPSAGVGAPHIRQRTYFGAVPHERMVNGSFPRLEGHGRDEGGSREPGWHDAHPTGSVAAASTTDALGERRRLDALYGFWRNADWLFGRDERWRPVEPGTQPLANGIPGRVARVQLHGYGNAINPWAAKEFIEAFVEAISAPDPAPIDPAGTGCLDEGLLV